MEILSIEEVIKSISGQIITYGKNINVKGISTDSRTTKPGDLFFAIIGDSHDGHRFVSEALNAGAIGAVVSSRIELGSVYSNSPLIQVRETKIALGDLAKYYRQKLNAKIVGITGSNGKTTTKEMTYHLLAHFGPTARSQKSYNNFIGVPLTIFEIENRHQYGVLEMGTNARGEIRRLSEIGSPDVAVITNISKTHLEGLGSIEGVMRAKGEILENLRENGAFVYNFDNPWCVRIASKFKGKAISFGFNHGAQIRCTDVKKKGVGHTFTINKNLEIYLPIAGYHNIYNSLAAFAVCHTFCLDTNKLKNPFPTFKLPSMRIEHIRTGDITIINDAYNANPESMQAALQYFYNADTTGRKVFICGDMLELGNESAQLHREIGKMVAQLNIDILWTVGKYAIEIANAAKAHGMPESHIASFNDISEISVIEINKLKENDTVLIKGSRVMHMEDIIQKFKEFFPKQETACNYHNN